MFDKYKNEVVTSTLELYKKKLPINNVYYGGIVDLLKQPAGWASLIAGSCALLMSVGLTLYNKVAKRRKMKVDAEEGKDYKREKLEQIFQDMLLLMNEYKTLVKQDIDGVMHRAKEALP